MARLKPAKAARAFCKQCMFGQKEEIDLCQSKSCPIYPFRKGTGRLMMATIRIQCLHCSGWPLKDGKLDPAVRKKERQEAQREATNCTDQNCPFFPYRPGQKPYGRKGVGKGRNLGSKTQTSGRFLALGAVLEDGVDAE